MFNLFNKKPKVRAGKQNNETPAAAAKTGANGEKKPAARFGGFGAAWKKLNSMDRKQAYTWGAVAVVAVVALLTLGSAMGSGAQEDFTEFETRGYDLANMPFSSDEAEQYLLASKYPDMKNSKAPGLYTKEEKEARQAEDAEAAAKLDTSAASKGSEYVPGRYYGGGAGGSGARTQVGTLNSANLKGASGSGINGSFGPTGDFSNFRSQDKGRDRFTPQGPGKGNARTALFQAAKGSRAAAGLKNDKLLNAKKAMMGGNVKGSEAFLSDSGAVSLKDARGLELDTNAPVSSADLGGVDDALQDAKETAEDEAAEAEEQEWWKDLLVDLAKQAVQGLFQMGMNATQDAIAAAQIEKNVQAGSYAEWISENATGLKSESVGVVNTSILGDTTRMGGEDGILKQKGMTYDNDTNPTKIMKGDKVVATKGAEGWKYEDKQQIKLGQRDIKKINERRQQSWETANPTKYREGQAYAKAQAAQAKADYFGASSHNSSGFGSRCIKGDTVKFNGVDVSGMNLGNNLFRTDNGQVLYNAGTDADPNWTLSQPVK